MLIVASLVLPGAACSSVYHKAAANLPPDHHERLALRVREAREAGADAQRTIEAVTLESRAGGAGALSPQARSSVQSSRIELERRTASIRDVASRVAPQPRTERVIASFDRAVQALAAAGEELRTNPAWNDALDDARLAISGALSAADGFLAGHASSPAE